MLLAKTYQESQKGNELLFKPQYIICYMVPTWCKCVIIIDCFNGEDDSSARSSLGTYFQIFTNWHSQCNLIKDLFIEKALEISFKP